MSVDTFVIVTPDHNWYGPYADEEIAHEALDTLRGRNGRTIAERQGTDWVERRALKVTTARYTSAAHGITIDWPKWPRSSGRERAELARLEGESK